MEQYKEKLKITNLFLIIGCIVLAFFAVLAIGSELGWFRILKPVAGDSHWHSRWNGFITGASFGIFALMLVSLIQNCSALKDEKKQKEASQKIIALGLSVRQAELLCKNMDKAPAPVKEPTLAVDYVSECEKQLSKQLGRGVKIVNGKRKGRFELEFYGQEDLQILLDALMALKK